MANCSTNKRRLIAVVALALAALPFGAMMAAQAATGLTTPSAVLASSTFDSDVEGWTVTDETVALSWQASDGNPGGYASAADAIWGAAWHWIAPAKFLGNQAAAYGGTLSFDLRQSLTDTPLDDVDLWLEGGGRTLIYDLPYNPAAVWTSYMVLLHEEVGWRRDDFTPANAADLQAVLADLTSLRIRGKYQDGDSTGGLDNVLLTGPRADLRRVPGTAVIFFGNRSDVTIPPLGGDLTGFPLQRNCTEAPCADFLQETFPLAFGVGPEAEVMVAAFGGMDYYGSTEPSVGPDGVLDPAAISDLLPLAGVSGYAGPNGALVGMFLDNRNPRDTAPPDRLDFSSGGLGTSFTTLSPALGQIFFIGDGLTGAGSGARQHFVAPAGASRLFLGIADGFNFMGEPGAYDDNRGAFYVQVSGVLRPALYLPLIQRRPPVQYSLIELRRLTPCENRSRHNIFIKVVDAADNPVDGVVLIQAPYGSVGTVLDRKVSGSKGPGLAEFDMWPNVAYAVYVTEDDVNPASTEIAQPVHANFTDEEMCPDGGGGNTLYHNSFSVVFRQNY